MMPAFFLADVRDFDKLYLALLENGVDLVVDIRLPRAFGLEPALKAQNELHGRHIEYIWLKYFGNPHFDRDDPHGSYEGYLVGMDKELEELYDLVMRRRVCIMDEEEDPGWSYRMVLAEALKKKYGVAYADLTAAKELVERYGIKD